MAAGSEQCDRTSNALRPRISTTLLPSADDSLPANSELIAIHVSELKQLFNAIDPSPFRERYLDPNAEEFITDWAKRLHRRQLSRWRSTWTGRPDCRTNRPNSGKPFTSSSITARSFRAAGCASSFAVAGRASSMGSAHSASRWQPEISSDAPSMITSPRFLEKVC